MELMEEKMTDTLLAQIIGYTGSGLALVFFISPIKLFLDAHKTRDLKNIPLLMFIANVLNCMFWIFFGFGKNQGPQWICNLVGLLFNVVWLIWYSIIKLKNDLIGKFLIITFLIISFLLVSLFGYYISLQPQGWQEILINTFGYIAAVMNVLMYIAPGQNIVSYYTL